ncbi:unnamed protein product [Gongylonema pulchrum]|uniref:PPM-type phosphatase domain-containing protein n=1 Tax=Gongylonema pulchrum TaxID=637853 RepID=A0A183D1M2_9BILA|nr:unnamed protein product [Gongylonema pulchrum]
MYKKLMSMNQDIVKICETDEFIIIGSWALWKHISPQQACDAVRTIYNPQIAAKKLQDMVQSLEYPGNVSIIVIRFKRTMENFGGRSNDTGQLYRNDSETSMKSKNDITVLRNIEERLEQIGEAINKIDEDSNNNRSLCSGLEFWNKNGQLYGAEVLPSNSTAGTYFRPGARSLSLIFCFRPNQSFASVALDLS